MEIRTDLALEVHENLKSTNEQILGIAVYTSQADDNIKVTKVHIKDKNGSSLFNKPIGKYYTIEIKDFLQQDDEFCDDVIAVLSRYVSEAIEEEGIDAERCKVLVVGLGNRFVSADSLGPKVVDHIDICERIYAIAPGVTAQTGIETAKYIKGVVSEIKPDIVLALDALAARSVYRLNSTIQISSTGIEPGHGIGNNRLVVTVETIGCPVIAIGVPTVIDAPTIISDALKDSDEKDFENRLPSLVKDMFVAPKDIDAAVHVMSHIVSEAINTIFSE